jgi:hypothetical protein
MSDGTQKIRDYIQENQQLIEETLVKGFCDDIVRFEEILRGNNIQPAWADKIANDLMIKQFVRFSQSRWDGKQILKAYLGFLDVLKSNLVLQKAIDHFKTALPNDSAKSDETSDNESYESQYQETYSSKRFDKTRCFRAIADVLNDRDPISDLCIQKKPLKECELHINTIGMGQDVREFDSRTGKILYVVSLLEEMKHFAQDVGKDKGWKSTMEAMNKNIKSFFSEIRNNILETKIFGTAEIRVTLKEMVEDPRVKKEIDGFVDSLVNYQNKYTFTNMFLKDEVTKKKGDREILSNLAGIPPCIKKLQNEMLLNTRTDCEIAAGFIDLGIKKYPKIQAYTVPCKIIATSEKSRAVLRSIEAL